MVLTVFSVRLGRSALTAPDSRGHFMSLTMSKAQTDVGQFELRGRLYYRADTGIEALHLWEPQETEIVLGRCSCLEQEVNLKELEASQVRVSRRRGGGCSVVVGPGALLLLYTKRGQLPSYPVDWAYEVSRLIGSCLQALGVSNLVVHPCGDICTEGRKFFGSCLYITRGFVQYGASLLVDLELSLVSRYLLHPPREPDYRRGRSHEEFLTTLRSGGYGWSVRELALMLGPMFFARVRGDGMGR